MNKYVTQIGIVLAIAIGINILSSFAYLRFDLTEDKRYTISSAFKSLISEAESPLIIDVFLSGNVPAEFRILRDETEQLVEEFQVLNSKLLSIISILWPMKLIEIEILKN